MPPAAVNPDSAQHHKKNSVDGALARQPTVVIRRMCTGVALQPEDWLYPEEPIVSQIRRFFTLNHIISYTFILAAVAATYFVLDPKFENPADYGLDGGADKTPQWHAYVVVTPTCLGVLLIILNELPTDLVLLSVALLFYAIGIIDRDEMLGGFGDPGVVVVAILCVVANGVQASGIMERVIGMFLGFPNTVPAAQMRMMIPVFVLSAFMNNTPIVAIMIPILESWCTRLGMNPDQFMMPLSYASLLGGASTMIGTSSNLITLNQSNKILAKMLEPPLDWAFFDWIYVGTPVALVSMLYILILSPYLLRGSAAADAATGKSSEASNRCDSEEKKAPKEHRIDFVIAGGSVLSGTTLSQSGLGKIRGARMLVVRRDGRCVWPVVEAPDDRKSQERHSAYENAGRGTKVFELVERRSTSRLWMNEEIPSGEYREVLQRSGGSVEVLEALQQAQEIDDLTFQDGDVLEVAAVAEAVTDFRKVKGLLPWNNAEIKCLGKGRNRRFLVEAIIHPRAAFLSEPLSLRDFMLKYRGVPLSARCTDGSLHPPRPLHTYADLHVKAGDILLMEVDPGALGHQDFVIMSRVKNSWVPREGRQMDNFRSKFAVFGLLVMVVCTAMKIGDICKNAFILSYTFLFLKLITPDGARGSLKGETLLIIAASFGVGAGFTNSGAASAIAQGLSSLMAGNVFGLLCSLYLCAALLAGFIGCNPTAVLMVSIALDIAESNKIPFKVTLLVLMYAAASPFSTPIGYQTNIMVMKPGGYAFMDYVRFGFPLTLINMFSTLFFLSVIWGFTDDHPHAHDLPHNVTHNVTHTLTTL